MKLLSMLAFTLISLAMLGASLVASSIAGMLYEIFVGA